MDREVGAVDLTADPGHARQHHRDQGRECDRVPVALDAAQVAQEDDREDENDEAADEPAGLVAGQLLVDPVDLDESHAREHRHERQQVGVGVRKRAANRDVRDQAEAEEDRTVGHRHLRRGVRVLRREHRREARGHQQRRRNQAEELAIAGPHARATVPMAPVVGRRSARRECSGRGELAAAEQADQLRISRAKTVDRLAVAGEEFDDHAIACLLEQPPARAVIAPALENGDRVWRIVHRAGGGKRRDGAAFPGDAVGVSRLGGSGSR